METVSIHERVDVGVVFGRNRILPKWFVWNTRKYDIKEVTYLWQDTQGEAKVLHFSVTDGATCFELSLNQKTLQWQLEKTMVE